MHLSIGTNLQGGRYIIEKVLGQGGFGITYLAQQSGLDRKVAIKEFFMKGVCERDAETSQVSISNADNKELVLRFREKFLKEARMIASFSNVHIISIHDVFEENGAAYYVMDYLDGKSLEAIVREQGSLAEADAVKYIRNIADALSEVHARNFLHLDIKPANIMLSRKGQAVLIDFGISKHYDDSGNQTSSGLMAFSDGYAPHEQYERGALDNFTPATDIYALGATLLFLLTGQRPPKASEVINYGLPELPSEVSQPVRDAVTAAMQPAVRMRPQSVEEFVTKLKGESGTEGRCPEGLKSKVKTGTEDAATVVNPPRPSENPGGMVEGESSDNEETRIDSSSTPGGEVSQSDGGENVTQKTENGKVEDNPKQSEESQKKHGKTLWVILLLLIAGVFYGVSGGNKYEPRSFTYVDLGLPSGLKWATCNAGADAPHEYGDYLNWDEAQECGLHIPTKEDFAELLDRNNCTWEWTTQNGTNGYKVTSKKNGNSIFLPAAGWRVRDDTSLYDEGSKGDYWSAMPDEGDTDGAYYLYFTEGFRSTFGLSRDCGRSVRPVSK